MNETLREYSLSSKRNFPQIVLEDLFQACNGIKQAKNKQENMDRKKEIYHLNVPVECPHCNSEMQRRGKTPDIPVSRWFCKMPNCTTVIRKDDAELLDEIHTLLNRLINDPAIIRSNTNDINEKRLAGRVTLRLNSVYTIKCVFSVFQGYFFNVVAAFYIEVDIGVIIAHINFVDQIVY